MTIAVIPVAMTTTIPTITGDQVICDRIANITVNANILNQLSLSTLQTGTPNCRISGFTIKLDGTRLAGTNCLSLSFHKCSTHIHHRFS
jgi:hypothetical protein